MWYIFDNPYLYMWYKHKGHNATCIKVSQREEWGGGSGIQIIEMKYYEICHYYWTITWTHGVGPSKNIQWYSLKIGQLG